MKIEITSTLPFGNSKYVTKDKQMAIEFCNLKKQSGDTDLRGILQE